MMPNNGDAATLKDERDGKEYKVTKLADGNYWMLDNLALDPTALTQAQLYGSDSHPLTNASNTTLGYLKNGGGTTSDKYPTAKLNNVAWTSSSQNYYSIPMVNTASIDVVPSNSTLGSGSRKVGVYYNYCAASAGSYCYGNGTSEGTSSGNATEDICPAGWRLPTGSNSGEYGKLYSTSSYGYNTYDAFKTALSLPLSGYFHDGTADGQGSYGYWWTSTRSNNYSMLRSCLVDNSVETFNQAYRYVGVSIRCVKKQTYTINFNANGGSGTMASQSAYVDEATTLHSNTFTAPSGKPYFMGWNTTADGSGTSYADGAEVTNLASVGGTVTLYAQWGITTNTTCSTPVPGITYMQELKDSAKLSAAKSAMTQGNQYYLIDNRDNKGYCVSKQADGKIWMTQNLDFDITGSLTSDNTNLTTSGSGAYSNGYSTSGSTITWTPSTTATTTHNISGINVSPELSTSSYTIPEYAEPGERYIYTSGSTSNDTIYNSLADCTASHSAEECAHYHIGNHYNWTAAIASNASSGISSKYDNAANSICPAGWRLPKGTASSDTASTREFGELWRVAGVTSSLTASSYATNGFNKIRSNPLFFVRGGNVYGSSLYSQASYGYYWSSTVSTSYNAYDADFRSYELNSAYYGSSRYNGFSVRCLAE